jgi:hypothetical protein
MLKNVIIPEAQDSEARFTQCRGSSVVLFNSLGMLSAVNLDCEHRFQTDKVENVITEGVLPAKLESLHLPASQTAPQAQLGVRHILPQDALQPSLPDALAGLSFHAPSPP